MYIPCRTTAFFFVSTCRIQNPNIPRAVRVGAAHGGAGARRGRAEQDADVSSGPEANRQSSPLSTNVAYSEKPHSNQTRVQTDRFRKQTLRTPQRRAVCASEDALSACRETRRSARRETRRSARRETRLVARRETRRSARRETRRSARRETRRFLRARRAGCASRARAKDVPRARCVRAGPSVFCGRRASPSGWRSSAGAEGWLTARPPQAAGGGKRPPFP